MHCCYQLIRHFPDFSGNAENSLQRFCCTGIQFHTCLDNRPGIRHDFYCTLRCLGAFARQFLNLFRNNGKPRPCAPGACGFHRSVQRQNVGLESNIVNGLGNTCNFLGIGTDIVHSIGKGGHLAVRFLYLSGDFASHSMRLIAALNNAYQLLLNMADFINQCLGCLILLQRCLVQLPRLPAQFFCHTGKAGCCCPESRYSLIHRPENSAQAISNQCKVAFVLHLRPNLQISVSNPA